MSKPKRRLSNKRRNNWHRNKTNDIKNQQVNIIYDGTDIIGYYFIYFSFTTPMLLTFTRLITIIYVIYIFIH